MAQADDGDLLRQQAALGVIGQRSTELRENAAAALAEPAGPAYSAARPPAVVLNPASPERISQWTGDLKLIERFECLSPSFRAGRGRLGATKPRVTDGGPATRRTPPCG